MSTTFPRVEKSKGYDVDEVEEFLEDARRAYTGDPGAAELVTSASIRQVAFTMRKGGYSPTHVDAALTRLEEAFATRERDRALTQAGDDAWLDRARDDARVILDRLTRPRGRRFDRLGILTTGYSVRDVDAFADRIARHLQAGDPLTVEEVRTAVFAAQRGGYAETQVDLVLDAVIDVLLAVTP